VDNLEKVREKNQNVALQNTFSTPNSEQRASHLRHCRGEFDKHNGVVVESWDVDDLLTV
jgi:hypothetical protein